MSAITAAADALHHIAAKANCDHAPEIRIVFKTAKDQSMFRAGLLADTEPHILVGLPAPILDEISINGVTFKLMSSDRGPRADAERIIKAARDAFNAADRSPRMNVDMILKMKLALNDLLRLVEGPTA